MFGNTSNANEFLGNAVISGCVPNNYHCRLRPSHFQRLIQRLNSSAYSPIYSNVRVVEANADSKAGGPAIKASMPNSCSKTSRSSRRRRRTSCSALNMSLKAGLCHQCHCLELLEILFQCTFSTIEKLSSRKITWMFCVCWPLLTTSC